MFYLILSVIFLVFGVIAVAAFAVLIFSLFASNAYGAPYVPVERKNLRKILDLGNIKEDDVFCDLGSGDGRVIFEAIQVFNAKYGIGYEASIWPYYASVISLKLKGLNGKVRIFKKDFLRESGKEFERVSFVYTYTYPPLMKKISAYVLPNLKKGARILTVSFSLPEENGDFKIIKIGQVGWHKVFIYEKIV
ncbi:hypothetical protein M1506_02380 [Patescibacteria group bacterium]|nr:hypothetical protein [Patescibacteria group bacterium]